MNEKQIMDLITSEFSWEQVIYKIIAWEGLDPWDLDITSLSEAFMQYLKRMKEFNFSVPAKYIIISAVLLKMKSDHLHFFDYTQENGNEVVDVPAQEGEELLGNVDENGNLQINPITAPTKRVAKRQIMVNELVDALRKVLSTEQRRHDRYTKRKSKINLRPDDVSHRINALYDKINSILGRIKKEEIEFSKLVDKWEKKEVINTFMPLVFLDNQKKVRARQEEIFDEIYIKSLEGNNKKE